MVNYIYRHNGDLSLLEFSIKTCFKCNKTILREIRQYIAGNKTILREIKQY